MRGSADLLRRIKQRSLRGAWNYIPINSKLPSKPKTAMVPALASGPPSPPTGRSQQLQIPKPLRPGVARLSRWIRPKR